jgi:Sel1 repeat-containing protein
MTREVNFEDAKRIPIPEDLERRIVRELKKGINQTENHIDYWEAFHGLANIEGARKKILDDPEKAKAYQYCSESLNKGNNNVIICGNCYKILAFLIPPIGVKIDHYGGYITLAAQRNGIICLCGVFHMYSLRSDFLLSGQTLLYTIRNTTVGSKTPEGLRTLSDEDRTLEIMHGILLSQGYAEIDIEKIERAMGSGKSFNEMIEKDGFYSKWIMQSDKDEDEYCWTAFGRLSKKKLAWGTKDAEPGVIDESISAIRNRFIEGLAKEQKTADQGDADAKYILGVKFANGRGVPQSDSEAIKWFQKAAEKKHVDAQYILGLMYANGRGVPESDSEALKWYQKAADQGHADAQCILGVKFINGLGVPQSDSEAVKWYQKAADQGHAEAQRKLALMYVNGRGVPESDSEAVKWMKKAADHGDADAQYKLGVFYANGRGVPESDSEALKWYQKAADQGHADANRMICLLT